MSETHAMLTEIECICERVVWVLSCLRVDKVMVLKSFLILEFPPQAMLLCFDQQIDCAILRQFSVWILRSVSFLVFVPLCKLCVLCIKHIDLLGV